MKNIKAIQNIQKVIKNKLLCLIIFLVITNLVAIFFIVCLKNQSSPNNFYSFLNPARKYFRQEDAIVDIQPLRDELNKIGTNPNISIYFEYLNTGANIAVNKDAEFFPASLLKLPVALAAVKKIQNGQWQWDNELVLMRSDKDEGFGDLYKQEIGTRFTIEQLITLSLVQSDNTAYRILLRNIDPAEVEKVQNGLGIKDLFFDNGDISAKRYSVIFRSLYNGSFLSEKYSQKILTIMAQPGFSDYLSSGLPTGTLFAHKIGISSEKGVYLDSGIIYLKNRSYLLTVMIRTLNEAEAKEQMKNISSAIYKYISSYSINE